MNILQEAKYIMANVENNNNKFWYIFRYDTHLVRTENGRVGNTGDSHEFPHSDEDDAKKFFDKKCKEKEKKGYKKLNVVTSGSPRESTSTVSIKMDTNLHQVAKDQIEQTSPEVSKLIERLTKTNIHNILESTTMSYNASSGLFSSPCGILDQNTIDEARELLIVLNKYVELRDYRNKEYIENLENYLMKIPTKVQGRKLDPTTIFTSISDIRKQNDILDSLSASLQSVLTETTSEKVSDIVKSPKLFSVKLHKINDEKVIDRIQSKYRSSMYKGHDCSHLDVKDVYSVDIETMREDFDTHGKKYGNIQELWHGTRVFNLLSILKGGLQIMPSGSSNITGRMFGATRNIGDIKRNCGLYFSDQSTKSLNYSYGYWDGGKKDQNCFMTLCDVSLGKTYTPKHSSEEFPHNESDSTFAKANVSGVKNNEYIIYRKHQCNLTHLVEFSPGGK